MVTLDFSKCKTKEDVDKVFGESSELRNAKAMLHSCLHPEEYCPDCAKHKEVCKCQK